MTSTNISTALEHSHGFFDDEINAITFNALIIGAGACISLFGVVTNIINIIVYMKQGVRDSITVQFITLSISDCSFSILVLASSLCCLIGQVSPNLTNVDPSSLSSCLTQAREKVYTLSIMTIFMMSIERCFCVAFPLTVKFIFTKQRSVKIVISMAIFCLALLIPEYLNQGLVWIYDRRFKTTRLLFWISLDNYGFEVFKTSVLGGLIPVMTGVAATVCALYIISAIKSSIKFRQAAAAGKHQSSSLRELDVKSGNKSASSKISFSGREARTAKTVVAVDIIFVICNMPKCVFIVASIMSMYIPQLNFFTPGMYQNLITILMSLTYALEAVNSACNFLIYFVSSTKFRTAVIHTFCNHLNTI